MPSTVATRTTVLALLLAGALAAPASAKTLYTAPGAPEDDVCTQATPCAMSTAVDDANANDEIVVAPGDYKLSNGLNPSVPVSIHGVAGQPRPRLLGAAGMSEAVLSTKLGGTVSHLLISSAGSGQALELQSGVGDDLVLVADKADAVKLIGSPKGTVLRDAVVYTRGGSTMRALTIKDGAVNATGPVDLRNVTAVAPTGAAGVFSQMTAATATLRNVIARGAAADIDGAPGVHVSVGSSNFRSELSPVVAAIAPNASADPLFVDPANGDFHLSAGSPAIDAGVTDPLVGAVDADGRARVAGAAPDMGAFEFGSTGALAGTTTPLGASTGTGIAGPGGSDQDLQDEVLPGSPPKAGKSVNIRTASGTVRVRLPGGKAFETVGDAQVIPVGATVDATRGAVVLASARSAGGATQNAVLSGGAFRVRQDKGTALATALVLAGGDFQGCAPVKQAFRAAVASARRKPAQHVVRQLWARDKGGRFRTDGRYASALVRGTVWLTQDRCDGTLVRVAQGKVVIHDRARRKDVVVKAGHSYLTRGR